MSETEFKNTTLSTETEVQQRNNVLKSQVSLTEAKALILCDYGISYFNHYNMMVPDFSVTERLESCWTTERNCRWERKEGSRFGRRNKKPSSFREFSSDKASVLTPVVMVATFSQKAQMASIGPLFEDANPASRPTSELEVTSEKNDELEDYGTMTPPPHAM